MGPDLLEIFENIQGVRFFLDTVYFIEKTSVTGYYRVVQKSHKAFVISAINIDRLLKISHWHTQQ